MKVISGGQTGVDIAALRAAKLCGIATGGWAPRGFKTQKGLCPYLGTEYGLLEMGASDYKERTYANVRDSDATLRIAQWWNSPGELCTLNAIKKFNRPYIDITWPVQQRTASTHAFRLLDWLKGKNVHILNVAGNSDRTCPGIEAGAFQLLGLIFAIRMYGEPRS